MRFLVMELVRGAPRFGWRRARVVALCGRSAAPRLARLGFTDPEAKHWPSRLLGKRRLLDSRVPSERQWPIATPLRRPPEHEGPGTPSQ